MLTQKPTPEMIASWKQIFAEPVIHCYRIGSVLVGIDLVTGEFHAESEALECVVPIHDDLFVHRGLDAADLKNFFLVAEYWTLLKTKQGRNSK